CNLMETLQPNEGRCNLIPYLFQQQGLTTSRPCHFSAPLETSAMNPCYQTPMASPNSDPPGPRARRTGPDRAAGPSRRGNWAGQLLIEEEESEERLVLCAGRDVVLDREVGEELLDLRSAHRIGVAQLVEANETFGPLHVANLGARRVEADGQG